MFALNPLLYMRKYILFKVDPHLDDDHKEETDHPQHDDAQEDAQLLSGIKPEEDEDDDGIGNTGAHPQADLSTSDQLICSRNGQDSVEPTGPTVCLEKCVSNTDTGGHNPAYQGCVENCQAVLVPENRRG